MNVQIVFSSLLSGAYRMGIQVWGPMERSRTTPRGPWTRTEWAPCTRARAKLTRSFSCYVRTKEKGSVSLTCRRLEGERTIAGAERRRQLRSMLFLSFWNSRTSPSSSSPLSIFLSSFIFFSRLFFFFPFSLPFLSLCSPSSLSFYAFSLLLFHYLSH